MTFLQNSNQWDFIHNKNLLVWALFGMNVCVHQRETHQDVRVVLMLLPVHVDICGGTQEPRQHVTTKRLTQLYTNPFSQFILAPSISTYFS